MVSKKHLIVVLVVCSLLVAIINCVDRSKFKSCDQLDFCRRNRNFETHNHPSVQVVPGSVRKASGSVINFEVTSPHSETLTLKVSFTAYQNGVSRFQITDGNEKRFQGPKEALVDNIDSITGQFDSFQENDGSFEVVQSYSGNQVRTVVQLSPFQIETFVNGVKKIGANTRGLFNFEHIRASREDDDVPEKTLNPDSVKPETWNDAVDGEFQQETIDNPKASGRWEEQFGSFRDTKPRGPQDISLDFTFYDSEFVFGLPEHATDVNLKMTRESGEDNRTITDPYRLYNLDVFEYELDNPMALYGAVPLLYSLHSASSPTFSGIFWLNSAETWIDISNTTSSSSSTSNSRQIHSHWISETGVLDFFILPGPEIKTNLFPQYSSLTGTTPLPPIWSLGYHQCKWNYKDEREVFEIADGFENADIPMDVIWLDIEHTDGKRYFTWDKNFFPDPVRMLNRVAEQKRRMVNIVDPHMKKDSNWHIDQELSSLDLFIKDREGKNYEGTCWPGNSGWPDYMLPQTNDWWSKQFLLQNYINTTKSLFIWNDMNEPSVFSGPEITMDKDALHSHGLYEHRDVHNYYGFLVTRATFKGLHLRGYENEASAGSGSGSSSAVAVAAANETDGQRPFILTRSFFAGSQRYASVWTGDNTAEWGHMRYSIPMTLSIAAAGIPFIGADVGGFFKDAGPELLTRWYQVAALQPFFREHGELATRRKEPFLYSTPWLESISRAIKKRYSYLPYIYSLFELHERTGIPVHRSLFVEFPSDVNTYHNQRQFMLGSSLLVAPVLEEQQTRTTVYFPGTANTLWYDDENGGLYKGGVEAEVEAQIDKLPVYQKGGTVVVKRNRVRRSADCMKGDKVTLVIALNGSRGAIGEYYEDDGEGYEYRNKARYVRCEVVVEGEGRKIVGRKIGGEGYEGPEVERIMIFGVEGIAARRVVGRKGAGAVAGTVGKNELGELWFGRDKNLMVIKAPKVSLSDDWRIEILN